MGDPRGVRLVTCALQDLQQHDIGAQELRLAEQRAQDGYRLGLNVAEMRDPGRTIDRNHSGMRPSRIASRSPSQPIQAKLMPACFCRFERTIALSAASTVERLVASHA